MKPVTPSSNAEDGDDDYELPDDMNGEFTYCLLIDRSMTQDNTF